jgi:hypothetical protein
MRTFLGIAAAVLAGLTAAACGPSAGLPAAVAAQPAEAAARLHPEVEAGALDGHVFEYH